MRKIYSKCFNFSNSGIQVVYAHVLVYKVVNVKNRTFKIFSIPTRLISTPTVLLHTHFTLDSAVTSSGLLSISKLKDKNIFFISLLRPKKKAKHKTKVNFKLVDHYNFCRFHILSRKICKLNLSIVYTNFLYPSIRQVNRE